VQQDTGSLLDDPAAVKANLKFINPKKVPCTVNFSILPQNGSQPGALMRTPLSLCA
jgi:hydrocephalus-inducing protein